LFLFWSVDASLNRAETSVAPWDDFLIESAGTDCSL
jgi:hypothetical protein